MTTRRERIRAETLEEIRRVAFAQVDEGGADAVSLNAIGRTMGMTGPAIYRYFASRDELLGALVTQGYTELAGALTAADRPRAAAPRRLLAVANAYRDWALAHPGRFTLLFGRRPAGFSDPAEGITAIDGAMTLLLDILVDDRAPGPPRTAALDRDLTAWATARGRAADPILLHRGLTAWTRLHGVVALEISGAFTDMGIDAGRVLAAEVAAIVQPSGGA